MIKKFYESKYNYYYDSVLLPDNATQLFSNNTFSIYKISKFNGNEITITLLDDNECSTRTHIDTITNSISDYHDNFLSEKELDKIYADHKEIKYMLDLILSGKDFENDYIYTEYLKNLNVKKFKI
jgi:hypothetical protein